MKKLATLFVGLVLAGGVQAQDSLADKINEADTAWILGTWTAATDNGTVELSYKWVVKDYVIASHFKAGDSESHSLIAVDSQSGEVVQTGFDNKGSRSKGTWGPKGEIPMLKMETKTALGETNRLAVAFRRIDQNNIEAQIFELQEDGTVGDFSNFNLEFKRKKKE